MAAYNILFKESVRKDIDAIPAKDLRRIMERIGMLAEDPRTAGSEKLSGQERYRIRQGNYRIVYSIQDHELTVWVVKVAHRREVYRTL
jgi:mRNA interferase RelE/StbE